MTKKKNRKTAYKNRSRVPKSPRITWLIGGILLGITVPSFFYLKSLHLPPPVPENSSSLNQSPLSNASANKKTSIKQHRAKTLSSAKNSKYDFYDLLSFQEEASGSLKQSSDEDVKQNQFIIEVAKYNSYEEADQLKAKLVLMGLDVFISKATTGAHTFYKVIAGPYDTHEQATKAQEQLKNSSISSVLIVQ